MEHTYAYAGWSYAHTLELTFQYFHNDLRKEIISDKDMFTVEIDWNKGLVKFFVKYRYSFQSKDFFSKEEKSNLCSDSQADPQKNIFIRKNKNNEWIRFSMIYVSSSV